MSNYTCDMLVDFLCPWRSCLQDCEILIPLDILKTEIGLKIWIVWLSKLVRTSRFTFILGSSAMQGSGAHGMISCSNSTTPNCHEISITMEFKVDNPIRKMLFQFWENNWFQDGNCWSTCNAGVASYATRYNSLFLKFLFFAIFASVLFNLPWFCHQPPALG